MPTPYRKTVLHSGKYLALCKKNGWEWVERVHASGVVMIVPINRKREVIFIEQYRVPQGASIIEFPAGLVGDSEEFRGEGLEIAARRELLEETGYEAKSLKLVAVGPPSAGMSSELIHIYLAKNARKVADGGGNPHENESITVHKVSLEDAASFLKKKIKGGSLIDPKVYAGLYFAEKS